MRKYTLVLVALLVLCATLVSCSKDESIIRFKASCERSTIKTNLNESTSGYYLTWTSGDQIVVYGENDSCVMSTTSTGRTAEFTGTHEGDFHANHDGHYYAAYPADQWAMEHDGEHDYYRLRLPENQTYVPNDVKDYPMFAVCGETASNMEFKNTCGILEINVSGAPTGSDASAQVTAIQISADDPLCGDFVVASFSDDGEPLIHEYSDVNHHFHYNTVELRYPTYPDLAGGKFMIVLPPSNYDHFKIEIFTTNHRYTKLTLQNESQVLIERSRVTPINIDASQLHFENDPYVPSLFSVSDTRQVRFAKGNVYYTEDNSGNGTWGMFDNQYEYWTDISNTHCDHFGRSLGEYNNYGVNSDYRIANSNCASRADFVDWGEQFTNYYGGDWRTLTQSEYEYVAYHRDNAENLLAFATVCDVKGMILLPDEWVPVTDIVLTLGEGHPFNSNIISSSNWEKLENSGAVFLPCAGSIDADMNAYFGNNQPWVFGDSRNEISYWQIYGCYWCSDSRQDPTLPNQYQNIAFSFGTGNADDRWIGYCQGSGNTVRLVQDAGWVSNSANSTAKGKRRK